MTTSSPSEFAQAARAQRACAGCGRLGGYYDAHHVVRQSVLKRRGLGALLWDADNALRLCAGLQSNRCHENHTVASKRIATDRLTNENVCFVWKALGVAGHNYLEREYTGIERRFTLHEEGKCPRCQLP